MILSIDSDFKQTGSCWHIVSYRYELNKNILNVVPSNTAWLDGHSIITYSLIGVLGQNTQLGNEYPSSMQ